MYFFLKAAVLQAEKTLTCCYNLTAYIKAISELILITFLEIWTKVLPVETGIATDVDDFGKKIENF